ncbi:unnamed protein product [Absidia cylindrospora]
MADRWNPRWCVFITEPMLHQTWANGWLSSSKSEANKVFKSDWVVYVQRCDIAVWEFKPATANVDVFGISCVFRIIHAPRLVKRMADDVSEGTFVHLYLDGILDGVFSTEPMLHQEWANGWLSSSKSESSKVSKPDWVVYVKPWWQRCDVAVCEVKSVNKMCPPSVSDFVKLGFQMQ